VIGERGTSGAGEPPCSWSVERAIQNVEVGVLCEEFWHVRSGVNGQRAWGEKVG
jgi:hypothetical protein